MATSSTRASTPTATPEELGFLASGPGRAAEAAIARLLDADLIRVSRQGLVTAVNRPGQGPVTPLEGYVLSGLRTGGQHLHVIAKAAAHSAEAEGLRQHLISRGLLRERPRKGGLYPWLWIAAVIAFVIGLGEDNFLQHVLGAAGILVVAQLFFRPTGPMTAAGKRAINRTPAHDRITAVGVYGLRGKIRNQPVYGMFDLTKSIVGMLPVRKNKGRRDTGTSSSSCGASCGSSCGSSNSCSSSSGSSCSSGGGSSCGGGGGGGD